MWSHLQFPKHIHNALRQKEHTLSCSLKAAKMLTFHKQCWYTLGLIISTAVFTSLVSSENESTIHMSSIPPVRKYEKVDVGAHTFVFLTQGFFSLCSPGCAWNQICLAVRSKGLCHHSPVSSQRQVYLLNWHQSDLYSRFHTSQGYTLRPCFKKEKKLLKQHIMLPLHPKVPLS